MDSETFDLTGAIAFALKQFPALDSLKKQKNIAEIRLKSADLSRFPKLNLSASTGINMAMPSPSSRLNNSLGIALEQPILSHSINSVTKEIAKTKDEIASLTVEIERDRLCLKIAKDFYAYSEAKEQLNIKKQKLDSFLKQLDAVSRRFRLGLKTQRDMLRFQAQVEEAKIQYAFAQHELEIKRATLITAMTGSVRETNNFQFISIKPAAWADEKYSIDQPDIKLHPIYKKLILEQKIASLQTSLSKRKLWPDLNALVSLTGHANVGVFKAPIFDSNAVLMASISLQYELFDFGQQRREITIALKEEEIKANAALVELSLEHHAINLMMKQLSFLQQSISLHKKLLVLEEGNFKSIENDYLQGKAQYLDVVSVLNNLSEVKSTLISLIFDREAEMLTHRYYEGKIYDWIF